MNIRTLAATMLLIAAGSAAQAASLAPITLNLTPPASTVPTKSTFTMNLVLDATSVADPVGISGVFIVTFNNTLLTYNSFTLGSGLTFGTPVSATNGNTQTVSVLFGLAPQNVSTVGTFSFTAKGAAGSLATLGLDDAQSSGFGSFVNELNTNQLVSPTFTGTQVNISAVPLPAGVWLLGTAVGALALRRRLRPTAA